MYGRYPVLLSPVVDLHLVGEHGVPVEGVGTLLAHGVDERIKGVDPPVRHAEF
jgi:hypothetical protein